MSIMGDIETDRSNYSGVCDFTILLGYVKVDTDEDAFAL